MADEGRTGPTLRQRQPDVEAVRIAFEALVRENPMRELLPFLRLGSHRAQDGVGSPVFDPARRERHGDRRSHDRSGAHRGSEGPSRAVLGHDHIGRAQAGADAFGKRGDVPGQVGREGCERRRRALGDEAIGIVLDQRDPMLARDLDDRVAPRQGDGEIGGVLERRIEIERLRRQTLAGLGEGFGDNAFSVHRQTVKLDTNKRGDRADAWISEVFAQQHVARLGEGTQYAEQRRMRARGDIELLDRRREITPRQPVKGGLLIARAATEGSVSEHRDDVLPQRIPSCPHACDQFRVLRLRRQVHREVRVVAMGPGRLDRFRPRGWALRRQDERPLSLARFDETPLLRLAISASDRGEIYAKLRRQRSLCGKTIAGDQTARLHIQRDTVSKSQITRLGRG